MENSFSYQFRNYDAIISALNKTVEIFTSHREISFNEVIGSGLLSVADAAGLNRIAVYKLIDKESFQLGQIYTWAYGNTTPLDEELVQLPNIPPIIRWLDALTKGECINGNTKDMPRDEVEFLSRFGVKSIFLPSTCFAAPAFYRKTRLGVL